MFVSILPFVLIFVIMYFLIIRPQRQQLKKRGEMLAAVRRGDTVVTGGGLIGKVTKVIDDKEAGDRPWRRHQGDGVAQHACPMCG